MSPGAAGAAFALPFHHDYLDQRIWRVSRDERLRVDLKLQVASEADGRR
jgi:hypothetical protein